MRRQRRRRQQQHMIYAIMYECQLTTVCITAIRRSLYKFTECLCDCDVERVYRMLRGKEKTIEDTVDNISKVKKELPFDNPKS